jgi:hypothetical protein
MYDSMPCIFMQVVNAPCVVPKGETTGTTQGAFTTVVVGRWGFPLERRKVRSLRLFAFFVTTQVDEFGFIFFAIKKERTGCP